MLPADDPFLPVFKETFKENYPPWISQREALVEALTPQSIPINFYDRHIASHLVLKNIVYLPKVTQLLSESFEKNIEDFLRAGHSFSQADYNVFPLRIQSSVFDDAYSVATHYNSFVGKLCSAYASKLVLHPQCTTWDRAVFLDIVPGDVTPIFMTEAFLSVIGEHSTNTKVFNNIDKSTKDRINHLSHKYSRLATWDMFAMTDTAMGMFHTVTRTMPFAWEYCRTQGCKTISNLLPPPDVMPAVISIDLPKTPKPRKKGLTLHRPNTRISKLISVSRMPSNRRIYRTNLSHYLQHAWAKAAMYDSTFIILHCGRYERIGFRHRGSQTLFLSGIIDTVNSKKPSYRELHVSLYAAIVKDALNRLDLVQVHPQAGQKRPAGNSADQQATPSKRRKSSSAPQVDTLQLSKQVARRNLALVTLDYEAFCSPAPSSFVRIGATCVPGSAPCQVTVEGANQVRFKAHEYIRITLKKPLGSGAIGIVHPAVLELTTESGDILTLELVMKLAFSEEQRKLMLNEYSIYSHLSQRHVIEGIVAVHGMFQDPESGALAMLMDHAGQSLRHRELDRSGRGESISTTEAERCVILMVLSDVFENELEFREAFTGVLKSLHKAGVRHNDVRPENLLTGPLNKAYIIDFDRAVLDVNEGENSLELQELQEIFEDE